MCDYDRLFTPQHFLDPSLGFLGFFGFHLIAFPSARKPQNFFIIFVHLESPLFEWELQTFTAGFKFEGPLTNASGGYKLHGQLDLARIPQ